MPDIATQRLYNQRLSHNPLQTPVEVISWLGAVQSQDYAGAKWAVAQRTTGMTDAVIDKAFNEGAILRTHIMRPTWHFVTPEDIRWMLELTSPRVYQGNSSMYRKFELDDAIFATSRSVLEKTLQGGKQLTRPELAAALEQAGIDCSDLRLTLLAMQAELDGVICSGARRGKQFTYALLDERAPNAKSLSYEEALAELTLRYFTSHGPATAHDFSWWSGLTLAQVRAGLQMVKSQLIEEVINGQSYWFATAAAISPGTEPIAYLLPNYDEYSVGYADRSAIVADDHAENPEARGPVALSYVIVINTQVVGMWKRTFKKNSVIVELKPFVALSDSEHEAVNAATQRFGQFLEMPVVLADEY